MSNDDRKYMQMAIAQAREQLERFGLDEGGPMRPNPKVGCVVVTTDNKVVAGYRGEQDPREHAEYMVLEKKMTAERLAGATVYTTLEPCDERTPPKKACADRLVLRQVSRVVIGYMDPDDRGHGYQKLVDAGITVALCEEKDLVQEILELNRHFIESRKAWKQQRKNELRCSELYMREPISATVKGMITEGVSADLVERGWILRNLEHGEGCTNLAFNRELILSPPVIRLTPLEPWFAYKRPENDDLLAFALFDARKRGGDLNNDRKIRVASDFIGKSEVGVQQTDYFSSVMTDQLAWDAVYSRKRSPTGVVPERIMWDGTSAFVEERRSAGSWRLRGLGETSISNQLGSSTLAFSDDGYLMIVHQSNANLQSANSLAPSGSGSLDWDDIAASNARDLLSLVRYGAERELREECALYDDGGGRKKILSKVLVTGFARMLHRAGKPEFFCLARIAAPSHEIRARCPERYVDEVFSSGEFVDQNARPRDEVLRVCQSYLDIRESQRGRYFSMSYSLEHALELLIDACRDEDTALVIDRFMSQNVV